MSPAFAALAPAEARRDDLVGVDVRHAHRRGHGVEMLERLHHDFLISCRTSVSLPVTAAAAAMAGLTRWVRAPLPWRPTKLRLEVEAQRSPGRHQVAVHADAHRAAGLAPLEARALEDHVEAFRLGLRLHQPGAGHDHRRDHRAASVGELRGDAQVLDAAVGAGADEDAVDGDVGERRARLEAHVGERALHGIAPRRVRRIGRVGHAPRDRRRRPPGSCPRSPSARSRRRRG